MTAALLYAAFLALATCIARGQGWIPDVRDTIHSQVDTTETEDPDTALACRRSPTGAGSEVRLWP